MKYMIQDTERGFQLDIDRSRDGDKSKMRGSRIEYRELGGHGNLEKLYAIAERLAHVERAERLGNPAINQQVAVGLACDELKRHIHAKLSALAGKSEELYTEVHESLGDLERVGAEKASPDDA